MIASWWRSTVMATSARSTGWHVVDLCYVSVARRILVPVTRAERRRLLLYPALLSLGAGALASCAGGEPLPPPQISAIRPLPPPQERSAPPPTALRPAHKPDPPASAEAPASATAGEVLAMTAPKPAGSGPAPEPASPPPDAEAISTSLGPAGSLPPKTSELIGMDQPAATRLFGAAPERSEE